MDEERKAKYRKDNIVRNRRKDKKRLNKKIIGERMITQDMIRG